MFARQALYFFPSVKGFLFGRLSRTHSGQTPPLKAAQSPYLNEAVTWHIGGSVSESNRPIHHKRIHRI